MYMQCHLPLHTIYSWNLTKLAGILLFPRSEPFPSYGRHNTKRRGGRQAVSAPQDLTEWISEIGQFGIGAYKVFEELITKKEKLSKAAASLNMVQRKGKANTHILELPEDDYIEE
jgi:hypothetical protein